jgi:hypothetical protein
VYAYILGENPLVKQKAADSITKFCCFPAFLITGLGGILTWGLNDHGQLQFGDAVVNATTNLNRPTALTLLPLSPVTISKIVATRHDQLFL